MFDTQSHDCIFMMLKTMWGFISIFEYNYIFKCWFSISSVFHISDTYMLKPSKAIKKIHVLLKSCTAIWSYSLPLDWQLDMEIATLFGISSIWWSFSLTHISLFTLIEFFPGFPPSETQHSIRHGQKLTNMLWRGYD